MVPEEAPAHMAEDIATVCIIEAVDIKCSPFMEFADISCIHLRAFDGRLGLCLGAAWALAGVGLVAEGSPNE